MKTRYIFCLLGIWFNACWGDFSGTQVNLHPQNPKNGPFIIEVQGIWPTDCHPGEQNPVISAYDGSSVLIDIEIIVMHVTCNNVDTPYSFLVDMSDVIGTVEGTFHSLDLTIRFGEAELNRDLSLDCNFTAQPCPQSSYSPDRPDSGSYVTPGLQSQGLFITRQNEVMAVFPLIYDDSGSSEWYIAGGNIIEDTFFANLYELTGGQCLGCIPTAEPAQENLVGKLTLLADGPGALQVRVNDGLFTSYEPFVFGYKSISIEGDPDRPMLELSGRWAFSGLGPGLPYVDSSSFFGLPLVVDISLKQVFDPPVIVDAETSRFAVFSVLDIKGAEIGAINCGQRLNRGIGCIDDIENLSYELLSPDRMVIAYTGPITFTPAKVFVTRID